MSLLPLPSVLLIASSLPDAFSGIMVSSLESSEPLCLFCSALIAVGPKILLLQGITPDRLKTSAIFTFPESLNMFRTQCCHKFAEFCRAKGMRIMSHTPSRMARMTTSSSCCFVVASSSSLLLVLLLLFSFSSLVMATAAAVVVVVVVVAVVTSASILLLLSAAGEDDDVK